MRLTINDQRLSYAKVYLDGKRVRYVIEADEQYGYIDRYEVDGNGALVYYDDRLQVVRERGVVHIVLEE